MKCKISVIIPVYNTKKYIARCLNSIISQTFKDFEIIVIDDGSTDNSKNIIKDIMTKHTDVAINYIYQKNAGQAAARNLGISKAKGEYISFVDSDDYLDDTMFEALYKEAVKSNADIVVNAYRNVYEDNEYTFVSKNFKFWSEDNAVNYMVSNAAPWGKLIKTSILQDNHLDFPSGIYYEDVAIVPAYALYVNKISYVAEPHYNYLQRVGSVMNQTAYNKKFEDIFAALNNLKTEFDKAGKFETYKKELEYIYINHLLCAASQRFLLYDNLKEAKENVYKISDIMKENFPDCKKNIYFKNIARKTRLLGKFVYNKQLRLAKVVLKSMLKERERAIKTTNH